MEETTTASRTGKAVRKVRTLVAREEGRRGKDRWHALFVFRDNSTSPLALIQEFRSRQHHEQTYRSDKALFVILRPCWHRSWW